MYRCTRGDPDPSEGKIVTPIFSHRDTLRTVNVWAVILDMMAMYHCSEDTCLRSHDARPSKAYHACIVSLFTQSLTQWLGNEWHCKHSHQPIRILFKHYFLRNEINVFLVPIKVQVFHWLDDPALSPPGEAYFQATSYCLSSQMRQYPACYCTHSCVDYQMFLGEQNTQNWITNSSHLSSHRD